VTGEQSAAPTAASKGAASNRGIPIPSTASKSYITQRMVFIGGLVIPKCRGAASRDVAETNALHKMAYQWVYGFAYGRAFFRV